MRTQFTLDMCFNVTGDWGDVEDIPYEALIEALEYRVRQLKREPDMDSFGFVDAVDVEA